MEFGGRIFSLTFLEGPVDRVIYLDYIVNRRFLFTVVWPIPTASIACVGELEYAHFMFLFSFGGPLSFRWEGGLS